MGTKEIKFESVDAENPAKFYVVSTPAHRAYPTKKLAYKDSIAMPMGDQEHMNKRTIHKYIDASIMDTCQLQMGYTVLGTRELLEYDASAHPCSANGNVPLH